ncbi:hypothetical protein M0802_011061 [Mischocyttarus mexicanus]|nr:hypothetical protein M0802_011061 [Mischocyttarus mexicanus]
MPRAEGAVPGCECGCRNENRLHWAAIKCRLHPLGADVLRLRFSCTTRRGDRKDFLFRGPPNINGGPTNSEGLFLDLELDSSSSNTFAKSQ